MSDPQTSMCTVMKPAQGFEVWMQGQSLNIPIPLMPVQDEQVIMTDTIPGTAGPNWDPLMIRYMPVPIGSTVLLWFPRIVAEGNGEVRILTPQEYRYQLRWRLRSLMDRNASDRQKTYTNSGSLASNTSPANTEPQWAVPASLGEVITPVMPTNCNDVLGLRFDGQSMSDSQGFYGKTALPLYPDFIRSPIFFPPVMVPAVGDELAIYAYRTYDLYGQDLTWDFDYAVHDAAFSLFYGVGTGDEQHPWYPSHGVYVATLGRATYP